MKTYGHPCVDTCCRRCYRRAKRLSESRARKRRARAAGKREIREQNTGKDRE